MDRGTAPSATPQPAPGRNHAARSGPRNVRIRPAVLLSPRSPLRTRAATAHRPARGRNPVRHRVAPAAAQADALATTFFVLGVEATQAYCEKHPELSVVFVLPGSRQGTVAVETVGIHDGFQLLEG